MKKPIALMLALALTISLTACGGSGEVADGGSGGALPESQAAVTGEIGGVITVSTYDTMVYKSFLEDAAKLFQEKYPGTTVNIETFSAMPDIKTSTQGGKTITSVQMQDDPQGRADYISKVNTALMSGEGADILAMDVLPIHKLAEGGQLENLAEYMDADPDFDRSLYRENILAAVGYKGGTWFLPMDYTFDYYAYDSTLLSGDAASGFGTGSAFTSGQLFEIAESFFDGSAKLFNSPGYQGGSKGGMWGKLLKENYGSFVDVENKKAHFDDGSFAALLESVKQYGELGYIPAGTTGQTDVAKVMDQAGEAPTDRYFFKSKNVFSLMAQFTRGSGHKMNIMISGSAAGIEDDDEIAGIAANVGGSVPFTYEQAYGINSNSRNKQTAWAFLKFLLSEEVQLSTSLSPMALPLLNSAREQKAEQVLSGSFMGQQGQPLDDEQREVLGRYAEAVEQLSGRINAYTFEDTIVNDMIAAEVQYFFDGSKTAGEVAGALQNKVDLYLNE